ncbi:MAG: hypothetical protein WC510_01835 [Candidatus Omnitrophota bacterium]
MNKCKDCIEKRRCRDTFVSWLFFSVGLIATVAIRVVTMMDAYHPIYGKIAWYIGVVGFFVFFVYKFKVDSSRARVIRKAKLTDKIHAKTGLNEEDRRLLDSLLCSLSSKKDLVNYFFIFVTSIIAFIIALYIDVFKR